MIAIDRWSLLAGLRFFLASIVLMTHVGYFCEAPWAAALGAPAFEAIAGFLLVSGYSIGHSYAAKPDGFFLRRAERIYPAYASGLLLAILAFGWPGLGLLFVNILFLNQLLTDTSFLQPAWSLSLEVWLYLLTPLLARWRTRTLWGLVTVSFVAFILYSLLRPLLHLPDFAGVGFGGNLLLLSFFWIAGFILSTRDDKPRALLIIALGGAAYLGLILAIQAAHQFKHDRLGQLLALDLPSLGWRGMVLALAIVAFMLIVQGKLGDRRSRLLNWLGDISYPLYLVHVPVIVIAGRFGGTDPFLAIALALVAATLSMVLFEYPIRRLRRQARPSPISAIPG